MSHIATIGRNIACVALLLALAATLAPVGWAYPGFANYASPDAVRIADNILSYQLPIGGWWGSEFTAGPPMPGQRLSAHAVDGVEVASFDNGGTTSEMWFLARVYQATREERFKEGFLRALDFVFDSQYPTGAWPQQYPLRGGYWDHGTFNDNSMTRVMQILRDIVFDEPTFSFVDDDYRDKAKDAFWRGVDFILKSQIEVDGRLTAWCAQHDPFTYEPRKGRPYEHPSISGSESVGIVRLLMSIPDPDDAIRRSILSAIEWFIDSELPDGRWARFYEIGTNWPIFSDRDGLIRYSIDEISAERQSGYAWYGAWPRSLIDEVRQSGYLVALYESLPDHVSERSPYPQIEFRSPSAKALASERLRGVVEFDIDIWVGAESDLGDVTVELDGVELFFGRAQRPGALVVDTARLSDGFHTLAVHVEHVGYGRTFTREVRFITHNGWQIIEEMRPPVTGGWFGAVDDPIDFLQADERSNGWTYVSGDNAAFFGAVSRKTRQAPTEEYLVWWTPNLNEYVVTVFVKDEDDLAQLSLSASIDGEAWTPLAPERDVEGPSAAGWLKATLTQRLDDAEFHHFRLHIAEGGEADAVQIGRTALRGLGMRE